MDKKSAQDPWKFKPHENYQPYGNLLSYLYESIMDPALIIILLVIVVAS